MEFSKAEQLFRVEKISMLAKSKMGRKFLKLRSLARKEHLLRLFDEHGLRYLSTRSRDMFREAYESRLTEDDIDHIINLIDAEQRTDRQKIRNHLICELYKLRSFDWGGLHQNSLEKTIVDNYVKKIRHYDVLQEKIDGELHGSLRGYVMCSWYNHWTSILIEDIFREHPSVVPAIGQVKKIDFFVGRTPFDLKVTYMPEGFVAQKRKEEGFRPEITLLKRQAREDQIPFENSLGTAKLLEDLWLKIRDAPSVTAQELVEELGEFRRNLVDQVAYDQRELIKWLYENQGTRRFDASNRIFLVLIDPANYFASWKLKRAFPLLGKRIGEELDRAADEFGAHIKFRWEDSTYEATSKLILIRKPAT